MDGRAVSAPQHCGWWMGDSVGERVVVYGSVDGLCAQVKDKEGAERRRKHANSLKYLQTLVRASVGRLGRERTPDLMMLTMTSATRKAMRRSYYFRSQGWHRWLDFGHRSGFPCNLLDN